MANLRAIRKRIASVKNTRQITRAMKLVSGAKLKRATDAALAARPYNQKLQDVVANIMSNDSDVTNDLFVPHASVQRVCVIAVAADRGLCGSYNSSVNRHLDELIDKRGNKTIEFIPIGRKVDDYVRRRGYDTLEKHTSVATPEFKNLSKALAEKLIGRFLAKEVDEVRLVFNRFKSAISQELTDELLLPLSAPAGDAGAVGGELLTQYIYEPARERLLDAILPQLVANRIMQALLEATASEHGARMTAMDSATRNATEMIDRLTLEYNRARQAAITRELVEIVSGAEAL